MVLNKLKKPRERSNANPTEKKPQGRWDEYNRPIGYIIGVTPGFAQFRQGAERMALSGLAKKIAFGARQGFDFVEVDFESIAEAYEHGVEDEVRQVVEAQGPYFGFGIHAPVTGEIAIDLGVANAREWERHHRNLQRTAIIAKKTGAKFILFHTSHRPRPGLTHYLAVHEYPVPQFSFTGENLAEWIENVTSGKFTDPATRKKKKIEWFKEWFKARFITILYRTLGFVPDPEFAEFMSTTEPIETDEGKKRLPATFEGRVMFAAEELKRMRRKYWDEGAREEVLREIDQRIKGIREEQERIRSKIYTPEEKETIERAEREILDLDRRLGDIRVRISRLLNELSQLTSKKELNDEEKKRYAVLQESLKALQEDAEKVQRRREELTQTILEIKTRADERIRGEQYARSLEREVEQLNVLRYKVDRCRREFAKDEDDYVKKITELLESEPFVARIFYRYLNGNKDPEEMLRKGKGLAEMDIRFRHYMRCKAVVNHALAKDFDQLYELWKQQGSEAPERVSYEVVAKYMSETEDPLWREIVEEEAGCRIIPDIAIDQANKGLDHYEDPEGNRAKIPVQKIIELIITAVACKYIQGHLLVKTPPWHMGGVPEQVREWRLEGSAEQEEKHEIMNSKFARDLDEDELRLSIYEFCKKNKIHIFVETEQPAPGLEGQLRVMHAHHHIALVKSIENGEHISYTIDFEHLTTNLIDPIKDVEENIKDGDAKYVRMVHINAPRPYGGLHGQIQLFSLDMYILYKWLWLLRKKGMKNAYLIWEWGAAGPPEDSAVALRLMIKHLEEDWPPDKLPPEFYGLGPEFEAAQYQAIRMHAMDPIEGLLTLPEHSYTFFGERAKELNRLAQWIRNKFRW